MGSEMCIRDRLQRERKLVATGAMSVRFLAVAGARRPLGSAPTLRRSPRVCAPAVAEHLFSVSCGQLAVLINAHARRLETLASRRSAALGHA